MKKNLRNMTVILLLCVFACSLGGCLKYTSNLLEVTVAPVSVQPTDNYTTYWNVEPTATVPSMTAAQETTLPQASQTPLSTAAPVPSTTLPPVTAQPTVTAPPATTAAAEKDPSQWSKTEVVQFLSKAVNDAKDYTGALTAEHTEEFSSLDITKCPGGQPGIKLANRIASGVIKPTTETLEFSNGTAQNSEKQTVPVLLPKRQRFTLTADGVQSARAMKNGALTVVELTLVSESSTLDQPPKHNSAGIGYLDPGEVDLSLVKIEVFNVIYTGSTIVATIDAQGRLVSASYTIPVNIEVRGSAFGISGEFACNGTEKETWKLNW